MWPSTLQFWGHAGGFRSGCWLQMAAFMDNPIWHHLVDIITGIWWPNTRPLNQQFGDTDHLAACQTHQQVTSKSWEGIGLSKMNRLHCFEHCKPYPCPGKGPKIADQSPIPWHANKKSRESSLFCLTCTTHDCLYWITLSSCCRACDPGPA